jgi:carboxymethylenebutenolidase
MMPSNEGRELMGEIIQFKRPDGKTCPGYLATPKAGSSAPGFVVIQEWWGLNDQIKKTADRLAGAGYRAVAPDLYRGQVAKASDEANHDAVSAKTAWDRTLEFLKKALE